MATKRLGITSLLLAGLPLLAASAPAFAGTPSLVSVTSEGTQGRGNSFVAALSGDGGFVAFESWARLTLSDTNSRSDIFLRNVSRERTIQVTRGTGGGSFNPALSSDAAFVAFDSETSTLVPRDTNGSTDVFVYSRSRKSIVRVSVRGHRRQSNGSSFEPAISANGRFVAFSSDASNLVRGDSNGRSDIFIRDRSRRKTRRVSVGSNGNQGNRGSYSAALSASGRYVAFHSLASNLARGDTNEMYDVFIRDRAKRRTRRVSISSDGSQADKHSHDPVLSSNGRIVAFWSKATTLVPGDTNNGADVFVRDLDTGNTTRVSVSSNGRQSNSGSFGPSISADGRFVVFWSYASNLVANDSNERADVFVHDRESGSTARISVGPDGSDGNGGSYWPVLSADGTAAAFESDARNLVSNDTNGERDIFWQRLQ